MNPLGTGQRVRLALLALGWLLTRAEAQPVPTNSIAPPESATNMMNATPLVPVDGKAALVQWRVELAGLAATNTEAADKAISAWLEKLLAGKLPKEIQFEVLEAARQHSAPAIQEKLEQYKNARLEEGGMATSKELLYGGNAQQGRKIFFEKAEAACNKCHKVGGEGAATNGPPLDGVATNLTREDILESILSPSAKITPGYETYAIKLKDLRGFSGMIKHESETELTIDCPPDGDVTFKKADILERRKGSSPMPDGFGSTLSKRELRDLIEFLAEPKKLPGVEPRPTPTGSLPQAQQSETIETSNTLEHAIKPEPGL